MREIGTMWQIGVLTGKPRTFFVLNRSFSAFWHYKNKARLSKGLDVKWHIPSTCLDASRMWFSTGIYSINKTSELLWLKPQQTPQNGQNVHGFPVRTPICHIVPVSRACPYIPPPGIFNENQPPPRPVAQDSPFPSREQRKKNPKRPPS